MEKYLLDQLKKYSDSDVYPYHMPGHKRNAFHSLNKHIAEVDITEIDGFDDLNHPEDLYVDLQSRAAKAYKADNAYFLVNGSTVGILTAVSALVPENGTLLTVRDAHKSVYNAACLHRVNLEYLKSSDVPGMSYPEAISAEAIATALKTSSPDAVLIVTPTYEGRYADVEAISKVVHEKGIPLIVDCAHGAHLGILDGFPANPISQGADVVICSTHKTLPALTQTGILLTSRRHFDYEKKIKMFLSMYQTSSPSYILTASIDNALRAGEDSSASRTYIENYKRLLSEIDALKNIYVPVNDCRQDIGKLVLAVKDKKITGKDLYNTLLSEYKLQPEMAGDDYCLLMFSVNDKNEAYSRLFDALKDIDAKLPDVKEMTKVSQNAKSGKTPLVSACLRAKAAMPIYEAYNKDAELISLDDSEGKISSSFICAYPPGTPIVVPGEIIDSNVIKIIKLKIEQNLTVQGVFYE